ncbi:MAG: TrmH family RNA methyltransferase [Myxococcaceae bacterium]
MPSERRPPPEAETLLLEPRKARVEAVIRQRTRALTVVLDRLGDSFNMAAVLRTCDAFGIQDLHVVDHPHVPFVPHEGVSQGCDKWLDIARYKTTEDCVAALHAGGYRVLASALGEDSTPLWDLRFDDKVALVFGNERTGVAPDFLAKADAKFWIPMAGFSESFNVSVATAISVSRAVALRRERLGSVEGDLSEPERAALRERFFKLSVKQRRKIYAGLPEGQ